MIINKPTLLFQDYDFKKSFDWILAIEPELWYDYFVDHIEWEWLYKERRKWHENWSRKYWNKDNIKKEFNMLQFHAESSMILEVDNMHKISNKDRLRCVKRFTEDYKWYFTLGWSKRASWWVHFHVFSQLSKSKSLPIFQKIKIDVLQNNLLHTLLYGIINDNKFYARSYSWFGMWDHSLPHNSRWVVACTKDDFIPWIEFRANNVFDPRLYWYYVAITLMSLSWIELENPIIGANTIRNAKQWLTEYKDYKEADKWGRIHVSKYKPWIDFSNKKEFNMNTWKKNLSRMLFVLSINKLPKAREALEEYIKEHLWLNLDAIPFDCTTNSNVISKAWYTIEFNWVISFFKDKKSLRKLLTTYWWWVLSTIKAWKLESITESLIKVNLISK